jgi:hypothetical protein
MMFHLRAAITFFYGERWLVLRLASLMWLPICVITAFVPERQATMCGWLLSSFVDPLWTAALVLAMHRRARGRSLTTLALLRLAARRYVRLIGVRMVLEFRILLGLLCGVAPGIVMAIRYALTDPVAVIEGTGPSDSRERSTAIVLENPRAIALLYVGLEAGAFALGNLCEKLADWIAIRGVLVGLSWTASTVGALVPLALCSLYLENRPISMHRRSSSRGSGRRP